MQNDPSVQPPVLPARVIDLQHPQARAIVVHRFALQPVLGPASDYVCHPANTVQQHCRSNDHPAIQPGVQYGAPCISRGLSVMAINNPALFHQAHMRLTTVLRHRGVVIPAGSNPCFFHVGLPAADPPTRLVFKPDRDNLGERHHYVMQPEETIPEAHFIELGMCQRPAANPVAGVAGWQPCCPCMFAAADPKDLQPLPFPEAPLLQATFEFLGNAFEHWIEKHKKDEPTGDDMNEALYYTAALCQISSSENDFLSADGYDLVLDVPLASFLSCVLLEGKEIDQASVFYNDMVGAICAALNESPAKYYEPNEEFKRYGSE